jgi:uncharacterized protein YceK
MKKLIILLILMTIVVTSGCIKQTINIENKETTTTASGKEQACTSSGGTVKTSLCCESVSDFPNTCLIGACGCSPENSHGVKVCECPGSKCFDGNTCT